MRRQTGRLEWTDETVTICHGRNNVKQNLFLDRLLSWLGMTSRSECRGTKMN